VKPSTRKKSTRLRLLRLGTRGSPLARTQSEWVARRLGELQPGLRVELVIIRTSGDRFSTQINSGLKPPDPYGGDAALSAKGETARSEDGGPLAAANVKAMFVKEIESALLKGKVDLAVHSSKDLPADLAPGLCIAAYPERELPFDVFLGQEGAVRWTGLRRGAVIGTASLRRGLQLAQFRPDLRFVPIRGNVHTRVRKMRAGEADGVILAAAGLRRLGLEDLIQEVLSPEVVVPAPGQGALAVEAASERTDILAFLSRLDHGPTRIAVETERALMHKVGGGCATPLGAFAALDGDRLFLRVFGSDPKGLRPLRLSGRSGLSAAERDFMVDDLAGRLLKGIKV